MNYPRAASPYSCICPQTCPPPPLARTTNYNTCSHYASPPPFYCLPLTVARPCPAAARTARCCSRQCRRSCLGRSRPKGCARAVAMAGGPWACALRTAASGRQRTAGARTATTRCSSTKTTRRRQRMRVQVPPRRSPPPGMLCQGKVCGRVFEKEEEKS